MKGQNQLESDSDWDSPTENNGSPTHTDDGESLPTDRSSHFRPKAMKRGSRNEATDGLSVKQETQLKSGQSERESLSDILAEAKIDGYQPDGSLPPHDFRNALQREDSIAEEVNVEVSVRQPKKSPKQIRYETDLPSPKSEEKSLSMSKPRNNIRKKKRISFDFSRNEAPPKEIKQTDEMDYLQTPMYKLPPTDFDYYDSVPSVKMEPIAERAESGIRWVYREAMTVLGLILSVFMIFIEELARIIALKIFSPLLHMIRYFLMAIVQLILDIAEFTTIGLKRVAIPLIEIVDLFIKHCCLPIMKAFKPIEIAFVSSAPLPHRIDRGSYFNA